MSTDCDILSCKLFRPLIGQSFTPDEFEEWLVQTHLFPSIPRQRREEEGVLVFDWHSEGISYSAGLQKNALIFVSLHFEPGRLSAKQLTACLGFPLRYQAWYELYPALNFSSVLVALIFPDQQLIAYGAIYMQSAESQPPVLDDSLPVVNLNLLGQDWADSEKSSSLSRPWPGSWNALEIKTNLR